MLKKITLGFLFSFLAFGFLNAQQSPVHWKFSTNKISDCEYELVFSATVDEGWHLYSLIPTTGDGAPNPTEITFKKSKDYQLVGKVKETPTKTDYDKDLELTTIYHEHKGAFTQKIKLLTSEKIKIKAKLSYQSCNHGQCIFPPADDVEFEIQGSPACATASTAAIKDSVVTDTTQHNSLTVSTPPVDTSKKHLIDEAITEIHYDQSEKAPTEMSWFSIFLAGFIGGFAALLTPCVFPMIPMNVSFFTKQSKTKQQGLRNALLYAIFIIVLYVGLGIGVTLIFGAGALHTLSTNVWFNLAFFVLLLVFAASFLGAFEIVLPSSFVNKMDSKADRGGTIGIFFMAFTLALVSFSCTGPIIGTLLVEASSTGNIAGPFWGMFGFALALALPFGLFAAFPGWLNSLPQSGGWLNSVKVTLGFLELALALKFASNADLVVQAGILTREVFIGLWIVIFGLLGVYLIGGFKTSHDSDVKHLSVTRLSIAIVAFFITIYMIPGMWGAPLKLFSGILPPLEYSESPHGFGGGGNLQTVSSTNTAADPEFAPYMEVNKNGITHFKNDYAHALAYAKKTGKPLMVDFTGHACANCRKTEDYVWPDPEVTKRLNNDVVLVSLYVDDKRELEEKDYMNVHWYGKERTITDIGDKFKYMEETLYGQSTQPLYILLDHNEKTIAPVRGYDPSIPDYIKWLDEGLKTFKTRK
jgi:thiol:disulfide interchange protein DsbD